MRSDSDLFALVGALSSELALPLQTGICVGCQRSQDVVEFGVAVPCWLARSRTQEIDCLCFEFIQPLSLPTVVSQCDEQVLQCNVLCSIPVPVGVRESGPIFGNAHIE